MGCVPVARPVTWWERAEGVLRRGGTWEEAARGTGHTVEEARASGRLRFAWRESRRARMDRHARREAQREVAAMSAGRPYRWRPFEEE